MVSRVSINIILVFILAVGCGGGDSMTDYNYADVNGLWRGSVTFSNRECRTQLFGLGFNFVHSVLQYDSEVTLEDQEGVRYVGNLVGDDGFSVDAPGPLDVAVGGFLRCWVSYRFRYDSINDNDDRTADVKFMVIEECSDGSSCQSEYTGGASRY